MDTTPSTLSCHPNLSAFSLRLAVYMKKSPEGAMGISENRDKATSDLLGKTQRKLSVMREGMPAVESETERAAVRGPLNDLDAMYRNYFGVRGNFGLNAQPPMTAQR